MVVFVFRLLRWVCVVVLDDLWFVSDCVTRFLGVIGGYLWWLSARLRLGLLNGYWVTFVCLLGFIGV